MPYSPGQDIVVEFAGKQHRAEFLSQSGQFVMAVIEIDPSWDYGDMVASLDPHSTVCVREKYVKPA